jgi:DNA-binding NtrC family response regulator
MLVGKLVLVVEDEPMIAMDLEQHFKDAGACVLSARQLNQALQLAETEKLSAGLLDFRLPEGEVTPVCERLSERGVPFVVYSGYADVHSACRKHKVLPKPVDTRILVEAVAQLLN